MSVMRKADAGKAADTFSENQHDSSPHMKNRNATGLPFIRLEAVKDASRKNRKTGEERYYNAIIPVMSNPLFDGSQPESPTNPKEVERYDLALTQWDMEQSAITDYAVNAEVGTRRVVRSEIREKYRQMDGAGMSPDTIWPALVKMFPNGGVCHGICYTGKNRYNGQYPACLLDFVKTEEEHQARDAEYDKLIENERNASRE